MGDRLVKVADHADGEDQVEVFPIPVLLRGRLRLRQDRPRFLAAADYDAGLPELPGRERQERPGDALMDEERLHRVADSRPLRFCIHADPDGHVQIRSLVDEDVADPLVVLDHRDLRIPDNGADQLLPAAGDDHVDELL